jgi:hypothetical protein
MKGLREDIKKIAKQRGHKNITSFINAWIKDGQTFDNLRDWLELEYGVNKCRVTVWNTLRGYLTIPYTWEDQFWYKWDSIARTKGFKDAGDMIHIFKKRPMSLAQISEELGLKESYRSSGLVHRLSQERINGKVVPKRQYIRHKFKMSRDRDGITQKQTREAWGEKMKEHGFRSLRDAIWKLKKKRGFSFFEIAKLFNITTRDLLYRRRRAGL